MARKLPGFLYALVFAQTDDEAGRDLVHILSPVRVDSWPALVKECLAELPPGPFFDCWEVDDALAHLGVDEVTADAVPYPDETGCFSDELQGALVEALCKKTGGREICCEYSASAIVHAINETKRRWGQTFQLDELYVLNDVEQDLIDT